MGRLDNYRSLVTDPDLWQVVVRSLVFCVVTAVLTVLVGGALAVLMNALDLAPAGAQVSLLLAGRCPSSRR